MDAGPSSQQSRNLIINHHTVYKFNGLIEYIKLH